MTVYIFLAIIYLVCIDVVTLRRESEVAYQTVILKSARFFVYFLLLGLIVLLGSLQDPLRAISFLMMFLVPYYTYKRYEWLKEIDAQHASSGQHFSYRVKLKIEAIGVLLHLTCIMLGVSICYRLYELILPNPPAEIIELLLSVIISSVALVFLIVRSARHFSPRGFFFNMALRRPWQKNKKEKKPWKEFLLLPVVLGLAFSCIASWIIVNRNIQPETPLSNILDGVSSPGIILLFLALAIIMAPFVEEITFRGYFYHVLRKVKGKRFAVIVIALTFSLLHFYQYWNDWLAIVMVTVLGFTLTFMRAQTGSTITSVAMHYVYNAGVTIIPAIILIATNFSYYQYQAEYPHLDFNQKEKLLLTAIDRQPKFIDSYNELAWLYATNNVNVEKADELIDKALLIQPENKEYMDTKAKVLTALGKYEEAYKLRERLLSVLDENGARHKEQIKEINELKRMMASERLDGYDENGS